MGLTISIVIGTITLFMTGWNLLAWRFPNAGAVVFFLWALWILASFLVGPLLYDSYVRRRVGASNVVTQFLGGSLLGFVLSFPSALIVTILLSYASNTM